MEAPTYRPTIEQFRDPLEYISSIREEAEKYGICKIIPPSEWNPPNLFDFNNSFKLPTRRQPIHTLKQGLYLDEGDLYTLNEYKEMADKFAQDWSNTHHGGIPHNTMSKDILENEYWNLVETSNEEVTVEYANDIDTMKFQSGFPKIPFKDVEELQNTSLSPEMFSQEYYSKTGWNLNILPHLRGSMTRHFRLAVNGVNVPWLYVGMQFSSFCWHTEDNYLYSINYSHMGDIKQWYGVPAGHAKRLEKACSNMLPLLFQESPDQMQHMTLQISPSQLSSHGVKVYQLKQESKSFIITFPMAYHGGFSYGFNIGEAVNFAIPDWLKYGGEAGLNYRRYARPSVLSFERFLFTAKYHMQDLPDWAHPILAEQIIRVLKDELSGREALINHGVQEISTTINGSKLKNRFDTIDEEICKYDDCRICSTCKQFCLFSAIGCECDNYKVSCLKDYHRFCKCSISKKFIMNWVTRDEIENILEEMKEIIALHKRKEIITKKRLR